ASCSGGLLSSGELLGGRDRLGELLEDRGEAGVGEARLGLPAEDLVGLHRRKLLPAGLGGQVLGLQGLGAGGQQQQVGLVLVGVRPAQALEVVVLVELVRQDDVHAQLLEEDQVAVLVRAGGVEEIGGRRAGQDLQALVGLGRLLHGLDGLVVAGLGLG